MTNKPSIGNRTKATSLMTSISLSLLSSLKSSWTIAGVGAIVGCFIGLIVGEVVGKEQGRVQTAMLLLSHFAGIPEREMYGLKEGLKIILESWHTVARSLSWLIKSHWSDC